ncbi:MAG TPA: tetratricopeptide repeat protein [Planctomycetota bacterium]|nr:tetratricopeptide repeat protein [Planctomycetota bacterium]
MRRDAARQVPTGRLTRPAVLGWALAAALAAGAEDITVGEKAYREGRYADAAAALEKVGDKTGPLLAVLGDCYVQLRQWDAAAATFQSAIAKGTAGAEVHRALGHVLFTAGRLDAALAHFRTAGALDPAGGDALRIAHIFIEREEWYQAQQETIEALRRSPDSLEALELLGFVLTRAGRPGEAAEIFRGLVRRRPGEVKYRLLLGRVEASAGRYGEAIDALEAAYRLGAEAADGLRLLADCCLAQQMPREAIAAFARMEALGVTPGAEDWHRLGHALLRTGELLSAQEAFAKAFAADPRHWGAALELARLAADRGATDEARAWFDAAAEASAESPVACAARGEFEVSAGAPERAAESFAEAIRRGDRRAAVRRALVAALQAAGLPDAALAALKEALREFPFDAGLRDLLKRQAAL